MSLKDDETIRCELLSKSSFSQHIMVDAGAGAGKTDLIARRTVSLIAHGATTMPRLVAISFTRKSSSELSDRIALYLAKASQDIKFLTDELTPDSLDDQASNHINRAIREQPFAQIGTIHSFCSYILKLYPIEAGVDPGFEELGSRAHSFKGEAFDSWWSSAVRDYPDKLTKITSTFGFNVKELVDAHDLFRSLFDILLQARDARLWDEEKPENYLTLLANAQQLLSEVRGECKSDDDPFLVIVEDILNLPADSEEFLFMWRKNLRRFRVGVKRAGKKPNYKNREKLDEFRARVLELGTEIIDFTFRSYSWNSREAANLLIPAIEDYEKLVTREACLDFDGIITKTSALLRDHPGILADVIRRFDFITVDEFQDTDGYQVDILTRLAGLNPDKISGNKKSSDKSSCPFLFLVGDEKQAIYRFRGADIMSYRQVREQFSVGGGKWGILRTLRNNHRSQKELVSYFNERFLDVFGSEDSSPTDPKFQELFGDRVNTILDRQARYTPQVDQRSDTSSGLPPLVMLRFDPDSAQDLFTAEAEAVAAYIKRIVSDKDVLITDETDRTCTRRLRLGDILLLGITMTRILDYERAFRKYGIPLVRIGGGNSPVFGAEREDLKAVLHAIDNPLDTISLIAALKGPFFGIDDAMLYRLRKACRTLDRNISLSCLATFEFDDETRRDLVASVRDSLDIAICRAMDWLYDCHIRRGQLRPDQVLMDLLDGSRFRETIGYLSRGYNRYLIYQREMAQIASLVRIYGSWGKTITEYERIPQKDFVDSIEIPPDDPEALNIVRYMTLHKAKGLEAPVVILTNHSRERQTSDWQVKQEGRLDDALTVTANGTLIPFKTEYSWLGDGAKFYIAPPGVHPLLLSSLRESFIQEMCHQEAEDFRKLYVACTRARDQLIFPLPEGSEEPPATRLWSFALPNNAAVEIAAPIESNPEASLSASRSALIFALGDPINTGFSAPTKINTPDGSAFDPSSVIVIKREAVSNGRMALDGAPSIPLVEHEIPGTSPCPQNIKPQIWGNLVHRCFESMLTPLRKAGIPSDAQMSSWAKLESLSEKEAEMALKALGKSAVAFEKSDFYRKVSSSTHDVEYPISMFLEKTVFDGVIDLLYQEKDGWVIADYKTSAEMTSDKRSGYEKQLQGYALMLMKLGLKPLRLELIRC